MDSQANKNKKNKLNDWQVTQHPQLEYLEPTRPNFSDQLQSLS